MKYILLIMAILYSGYSYSCSCRENSRDPNAALENASVVALVRVCEAHLEKRNYEAYELDNKTDKLKDMSGVEDIVVATAYPEKVYKGKSSGKIILKAGNPNSMCHVPLLVGKKYLAFVGSDGVAYVGYCSPSMELYYVDKEFLRKIEKKSSNKKPQPIGCAAG